MSTQPTKRPRYRFGEFVLSPSRRLMVRRGREVPLIPRYFDLLLLLIERRDEAVPRQEILDTVWSDVVVSDGALSQAVRVLRRTLGDDPRHPTFLRTVSRHGYQFVHPELCEEEDEGPLDAAKSRPEDENGNDAIERELTILLSESDDSEGEHENGRREAAIALHLLDTEEALRRLDRRPGHARARALLRDARWDVTSAGPVPLVSAPGAFAAILHLLAFRLRRARRLVRKRWASAAAGGAIAGLVAGCTGGAILRFGPGSRATDSVIVALGLVGLAVGGLGAAGVGAGLAAAEALLRSMRRPALVLFGALGGGLVGASAHFLGRMTLEGLFGRDLSPLAGGFEGIVLGAAAGLGYGLGAPRAEGGLATPKGAERFRTALATGLACAVAAVWLAATGRHLGAMSLDFLAHSFPGSQVSLDPLARLLGEPRPGLLTRLVISAGEGLLFGVGLILGLTRRPR